MLIYHCRRKGICQLNCSKKLVQARMDLVDLKLLLCFDNDFHLFASLTNNLGTPLLGLDFSIIVSLLRYPVEFMIFSPQPDLYLFAL